jgi:hypothetical protein
MQRAPIVRLLRDVILGLCLVSGLAVAQIDKSTVRGQVVGGGGAAVADLPIRAFSVETRAPVSDSVVTNANGEYELEVVARAGSELTIRSERADVVLFLNRVVVTEQGADHVDLQAIPCRSALDLSVVDLDGRAVPGARVVCDLDGSERTTDGRGRLSLRLPAAPSPTPLKVMAAGYASNTVTLLLSEGSGRYRTVLTPAKAMQGVVLLSDGEVATEGEVVAIGDPSDRAQIGTDGRFSWGDRAVAPWDLAGVEAWSLEAREIGRATWMPSTCDGTVLLEPAREITGRVTDEAGDAVSGAVVFTMDSHFTAITGRDGEFVLLAHRVSGAQRICARLPGFALAIRDLPEGDADVQVDIRIERPRRVSGIVKGKRVIDEALESTVEQAVPDALVAASVRGQAVEFAWTGPDGGFVLRTLPDEEVALGIVAVGLLEHSWSGTTTLVPRQSERATLEALWLFDQPSFVPVDAQTGDPIEEVLVRQDGQTRGWAERDRLMTTTAHDGAVTFPLTTIPHNMWLLRVESDGYVASDWIRVSPGNDAHRGQKIELSRGADVAGSVFDADGTPVEGAIVRLIDDPRGWLDQAGDVDWDCGDHRAQADENGAFSMRAVRPGKWPMMVAVPERFLWCKPPVGVAASEDPQRVDLRLPPAHDVEVRIPDLEGAHRRAIVFDLVTDRRVGLVFVTDGACRLRGIYEGDYALVVFADGQGPRREYDLHVDAVAAEAGVTLQESK